MASFKILKLRSKKYDFLFLSYFFFFHLQCLHPLNLLFWTLGKKICGHLAVFQETRLRLSTCHIFSAFLSSGRWGSTPLLLSLRLAHSVTFNIWMENSCCPYLPSFTRIFLAFPLLFLLVLSFSFTSMSGILQVSIGFVKYKILWECLGLLNQGR